MKKIILKEVQEKEVQVMQGELFLYHQIIESEFRQPHRSIRFLDAIMEIDIAFRLWYAFRTKIETIMPKKGFTITLRASEAAVLLKCCLKDHGNREPFTNNVMEKYKLVLDQQLKSL